MAAGRVSLALDEELVAEAREIVGARGLSGYVDLALSHQLQHDRLSGLLADLVQEHGPIDPQMMEEVRQEWLEPEKKTARRIA
jgi:Arc/MetJ family transcription regulator